MEVTEEFIVYYKGAYRLMVNTRYGGFYINIGSGFESLDDNTALSMIETKPRKRPTRKPDGKWTK